MHGRRRIFAEGSRSELRALIPVILGTLLLVGVARADEVGEKKPQRWTNSTDLSLAMTSGNANVFSLGLKDTFEYKTPASRSRFRVDVLRTDKSDDTYFLVDPGFTFQPGETLSSYSTTVVRPASEPDVARYFAEARHEHDLPRKATWNAGASWDRNEDAGIVNRSIAFAGLGNTWRDRDDLAFRTSYGLSYTDREEDVPDPEKERRFPGARLTSDFKDKWGKSATYDNDFTFNVSLADFGDFNIDLVQGLAVVMSKRLSLKISLQWLYASEPALEEIDVLARVRVVDPDGVPGTGDELFETVESGGQELTIGVDRLRKEHLDTTFRTSLQITF